MARRGPARPASDAKGAKSASDAKGAKDGDGDPAALLRAAGLRSTAPRVAVLGAMLARKTPASHADLCRSLEKVGLDRATIYRNLTDLAEAGILTRVDVGDHVWRFEMKQRRGDHVTSHPHFVCRACGKVTCLEGTRVKITGGPNAPRSLTSEHVAVQLTGACDECA